MSVEGMIIALTGKFTTMKRSEAAKKLEALGAIVASGNIDILIAGGKGGQQAQQGSGPRHHDS